MRKEIDQNERGLLVLHQKNSDIEILHVQTKATDIMRLSVQVGNLKMNIIVVYFSLLDTEKYVLVKT